MLVPWKWRVIADALDKFAEERRLVRVESRDGKWLLGYIRNVKGCEGTWGITAIDGWESDVPQVVLITAADVWHAHLKNSKVSVIGGVI